MRYHGDEQLGEETIRGTVHVSAAEHEEVGRETQVPAKEAKYTSEIVSSQWMSRFCAAIQGTLFVVRVGWNGQQAH